MGQKTNPNIFRLGKTKNWDLKYFETKNSDISKYAFKNLELNHFILKFFEDNKLNVYSYKIFYAENSLYIFVSYFANFKSTMFLQPKRKQNFYEKIKKITRLKAKKVLKFKRIKFFIKTLKSNVKHKFTTSNYKTNKKRSKHKLKKKISNLKLRTQVLKHELKTQILNTESEKKNNLILKPQPRILNKKLLTKILAYHEKLKRKNLEKNAILKFKVKNLKLKHKFIKKTIETPLSNKKLLSKTFIYNLKLRSLKSNFQTDILNKNYKHKLLLKPFAYGLKEKSLKQVTSSIKQKLFKKKVNKYKIKTFKRKYQTKNKFWKKKHRKKRLCYFRKVWFLKKTKIKTFDSLLKTNFLNRLFKNINTFFTNKPKIILNLHQINNLAKKSFSKNQIKFIKINLNKLRFFNDTPYINEGLQTILLCLTHDKSSHLLANYLAKELQNHKRQHFFLNFIQKAFNIFNKKKFCSPRNIKIQITGRFNGAPRSKTRVLRIGNPLSVINVQTKIYYSQVTSFSSNGTFGIRIWISTIKNKKINDTRA